MTIWRGSSELQQASQGGCLDVGDQGVGWGEGVEGEVGGWEEQELLAGCISKA